MNRKVFPATLATFAATLLISPFLWAADSAPRSEQAERCLQLSRLDKTEVLSNHQILFQTLGHQYYVNTLPYPCPGLRRDSTLMFRTSIDLVCDVDVVTVLDHFGWGLRPGASCGLGKFDPLDPGEVKQLRQAARERPAQSR